jgi:hypothetical protein
MDALMKLNMDANKVKELNPDALRMELEQIGLVPVPALTPRPMPVQSLAHVNWFGRMMTLLRGVQHHAEPAVESVRPYELGR